MIVKCVKQMELTRAPRASAIFFGASLGPSFGLDMIKISIGMGGLGISSWWRILANLGRQLDALGFSTKLTFCGRAHEEYLVLCKDHQGEGELVAQEPRLLGTV
jgi:hypothetical protein